MRLRSPIPMSSGAIESTDNIVVKLVTDSGHVGWGEGVEAPALTAQRQADVITDIEALRPLVIGADPQRRNQLWLQLVTTAPEATTAIAAIDIAVHDLVGKALGVPVYQLLGGLTREHIPALTLVGSGDASADAEKLSAKFDEGYRWFKVKLGMGAQDDEVRTLAKAVEIAGADGVVCGDANEAWQEDTAAAFLERLSGLGVRFVEQPISRREPERLKRLAAASPVAICADEGAGSLGDILALAGSPVGGVSLKLIKHAGITGVMRAAAICTCGGLAINLAGKVIESSISAAANIHCAAALDNIDYGCSPANQGVVLDISREPIALTRGGFDVPTGVGLGVDVDEQLLAELSS